MARHSEPLTCRKRAQGTDSGGRLWLSSLIVSGFSPRCHFPRAAPTALEPSLLDLCTLHSIPIYYSLPLTHKYLKGMKWTSLEIQWLRFHPPVLGGVGWIPGRGAKLPYALCPKHQNIKQKQYCNKFNKGF